MTAVETVLANFMGRYLRGSRASGPSDVGANRRSLEPGTTVTAA
jgi:hypothetical protein